MMSRDIVHTCLPTSFHVLIVFSRRGLSVTPDVQRCLMGTEASREPAPQLLASLIDRLPPIWRLLVGGIVGGFAGGLVAGFYARGAMRQVLVQ
jgi:hypothetical protein